MTKPNADVSWRNFLKTGAVVVGGAASLLGTTALARAAGDTGSLLADPKYQRLDGPWIDGKDPAV